MVESETRGVAFRRRFELFLSEDIRPFLQARAFTRSGRAFRRQRGPLYDVIDFQGNRWNGVTPWHGFFINIGVGSTDVDAVCERPMCLLSRRWERVVEDLPYELAFDETTDMTAFAEALCAGLERVLAVIEKLDTTEALVQWAIANNKLSAMEQTCTYLAATDDIGSLTRYISELREGFGHQSRWEMFNRRLTAATGPWADTLVEQGVLDAIRPD